jgi:hypothetical protein
MKTSILAGVILIVLGCAALAYKNFTYTSEETVVQLGSLKATAETEKEVSIPNSLAIGAIAAGILVLIIGGRK